MGHKAAHGYHGNKQKCVRIASNFKNFFKNNCPLNIDKWPMTLNQMVQCCPLTMYTLKINVLVSLCLLFCPWAATVYMEVRFFTTQGSGSALQGDLPGEVISSGLLCLQLFLGARKHIPPKQQHLRQVVAHKGGAWAQTECGACAISNGVSLLNQKLAQSQDTDLPRVMRAPSSSQPACVRCKDSRLFCAADRKRSSAILTTSYKQRTHTVPACKLVWTLT